MRESSQHTAPQRATHFMPLVNGIRAMNNYAKANGLCDQKPDLTERPTYAKAALYHFFKYVEGIAWVFSDVTDQTSTPKMLGLLAWYYKSHFTLNKEASHAVRFLQHWLATGFMPGNKDDREALTHLRNALAACLAHNPLRTTKCFEYGETMTLLFGHGDDVIRQVIYVIDANLTIEPDEQQALLAAKQMLVMCEMLLSDIASSNDPTSILESVHAQLATAKANRAKYHAVLPEGLDLQQLNANLRQLYPSMYKGKKEDYLLCNHLLVADQIDARIAVLEARLALLEAEHGIEYVAPAAEKAEADDEPVVEAHDFKGEADEQEEAVRVELPKPALAAVPAPETKEDEATLTLRMLAQQVDDLDLESQIDTLKGQVLELPDIQAEYESAMKQMPTREIKPLVFKALGIALVVGLVALTAYAGLALAGVLVGAKVLGFVGAALAKAIPTLPAVVSTVAGAIADLILPAFMALGLFKIAQYFRGQKLEQVAKQFEDEFDSLGDMYGLSEDLDKTVDDYPHAASYAHVVTPRLVRANIGLQSEDSVLNLGMQSD